MNIKKRCIDFNSQPKTIHWKPDSNVSFPPSKRKIKGSEEFDHTTWDIYSQEKIAISPKEGKRLSLGF